jgi:hypothetical protein
MDNTNNKPIPDPRKPLDRDENQDVHNRTGSTDHNDYKIEGTDGKNVEHRNEKESYTDYNGNSESNNPARAGS